MSKKVVRNRDSFIKNWTAAITGSFVLVSAQAAAAHERGAFREFRANNPGLEKRELRQAFRQQTGPGGLNITPVPNSTGASNLAAPAINRHQARIEARMLRNDGVLKQSFQANSAGQLNNIQRGVDLDLTSQVANITLGEKLFGNTSSIEIQVGSETKTLSAGSQVTAAEYVAAKQVLAGVGQRVTIGSSGGATGGDVDLSAITGNGDVLRASNLTVPVNVTTTGDFSRGSEFRLLGDLSNSGTVHATDSSGNGRGGTLRADDILNNAGASITSDVDLNLHADGALVNHGSISSQGNLTITSSDVTNRGSISSAKDVNLNASPAAGLNVDNAGGTISAANNINVNAGDLDANLSGGNYLSQNLNLNAGAGTVTASLDDVSGSVNSTGYAVHFNSATETLNIGDTNLIDPTFYNVGNINFTASVSVAADLTVIATGDITETTGNFSINTNNGGAAVNGGNLTLIAGANITNAPGTADANLPSANPGSLVTFNQGSIGGGSINLNNAAINTKGSAGGNGGNVLLAAFAGNNAGSGEINLLGGGSGSSIATGGNGAGKNGDVLLVAPNGIDLNGGTNGSINTTGGTGTGGRVEVVTTQPFSTGPVTYNQDGSLASGSLTYGTTVTNAAIDLTTVTANELINIISGSDTTIGTVNSATGTVFLSAGRNPFAGNAVVDAGAVLTLNGSVSALGINGAILLETADNLQQNSNNDLTATKGIVIDVGVGNGAAPGGADYNQFGSITSQTDQVVITVGDTYTLGNNINDSVIGSKGVTILVGNETGTGNMTQNAAIQAGAGGVDGSVSIKVAGDFLANSTNAKIFAGQGQAGFTGSITIAAGNLQTVAGANILGRDVFLTSDSTNGGDFDLAGLVSANKAGDTTGIISLTQTGTQTFDISDNDLTGGLVAQQITLTNNSPNGLISILNNATPINFRDVTANATGDIFLVEQFGGIRDGNINFTGASTSGGTFSLLFDSNITNAFDGSLSGVNGDFRSNGVGGNGNIGFDSTIPLNINFANLRVQALGGPSPTAGNVFLNSEFGAINFSGADSIVTGVIDMAALLDITTSGATVVHASTAFFETAGNVGTDFSNPFRIDVLAGAGQGVQVSAATGNAFLFDPTASAIDGGTSSTVGKTFSFVAGGDLSVRQNVTATDVEFQSGNDLDFGPAVTINATGDVRLTASNDISSDPTSKINGVSLDVDVNGVGTLYTNVDSLATDSSSGSLTVFEDDGIQIDSQDITNLVVNASQVSGGDITTLSPFFFSIDTLTFNNPNGNIFVNHVITGKSITLDTSAGSGDIGGVAGLFTNSAILNTSTGDIDLKVSGLNSTGSTIVTAQSSAGGDVAIRYTGTKTLTLLASSGNGDFTAINSNGAATIAIGGDIDGSGALSLTTNNLSFTGAFTLDFDSATVDSLAGSGLTLDGGGIGIGGSFTTNAAGPGVIMTATDGSFFGLNTTNFNGGDLFVQLANNNGINSFDVTGGTLNGDNTNDVTIKAALVIAPSLTNLTNWNDIILLGNTIQNSIGDVILPGNLIFKGQNLAIIASGNVSAGTATIIDLDSTTGNGGTLTVLAGFANSPATPGQITTQNPVSITGFSPTGGNIDLGIVNIDTSSTAVGGNAGSVTLIAAGGTGGTFLSAGTVNIGSITATGDNGGFGGTVVVGGSSDVTVGDIKTTGTTSGGDVLLGVGTVEISGTPVYTNGLISGGGYIPDELATGNMNLQNINAGTGDVALAGALAPGNTMNSALGTTIQADNLEIFVGAGSTIINTNVNEVQGNASATGGVIQIDEADSIDVDHFDGSVDLTVSALNDINIIGDINVNALFLVADTVTTLPLAKITAGGLVLDVQTSAVVNTEVDGLTVSNGTALTDVTVNEDDGVELFAVSTLNSLTINASQVTGGVIHTNADFSVGTLTINNDDGDIFINNQVTGTDSVTLDTSAGTGGIAGAGTIISPTINLFSDTNDITVNVNGIADASTDVTAEAISGGNVNLTYLGTGTITLESSTGNTSFTVATTALNNGSVAIAGDIDGAESLNITTGSLSFTGASNVTVDFDDINVQSFAGGSGLTIDGGANQGTFTSITGVVFTATDGDLTTSNQLNFIGGNVFMTLGTNNGINAFSNLGVLNGDGAFDGDPTANSLTITAALITPGTIQNFNNTNILQGNTIVNNAGNVILPTNLTFSGKNLAIIASGNISASGATLIDLSSSTTDGGTLTVLAGVTSTGTTPGQKQTIDPVTVTGFSASGGNIDLSGVDIDTSSTAVGGSAGRVTILAASASGFANAGTVETGNITATGTVNGGLVTIGGFSDITIGDIDTSGGTAGNDVSIGIGPITKTGTPVFTNGTLSGGSFAPALTAATITAGDIAFGTIDAGGGDVRLASARTAGDTISGGAISGDGLTLIVGAGAATVTTDLQTVAVDATAAAAGSVSVTDADDISITSVTGANLALTVSTTSDIGISGPVNVGTGTVTLEADDVAGSGSLTAGNLALDLTGDATLTTTTIANLLDSSFASLLLNNTGALTVNDLTASGFITLTNTGNLTVAASSNIAAVDGIFLQTLGATPGNIAILGGVTIATAGATKTGAGEGDVTILQGAAPTRTRNIRGRNINVETTDGFVLTGRGKGTKRVVANGPAINNLTGTGATLLIKAQVKNGIVIGGTTGGVNITADPPVAAGTRTFSWTAPSVNPSKVSTDLTPAIADSAGVLAINKIPTLTSAPSINLNDTVGTLSNLATANTNLTALAAQEDDSYMVGYAPSGQMVDGNVCSDMDFGFTTSGAKSRIGNGVATMKHSTLVTLENGSALFVPSKDMTVVTPKGSVKLSANSVAFVNVNSDQLSVYDINDHHKSSVVVSTGGRDLALSPGRHLVVTNASANSFADVNPIESIMHRSVNRHELGAGKRAFVTEFSIPSAVSVLKPLKAMMASNDEAAKKVANRVLKTSAVVMMVGGNSPFEFHAKPRTVALNWK